MVLTNGDVVTIVGAELIEDSKVGGMLIFKSGRAVYRFNWAAVSYYVARHKNWAWNSGEE